MKKGVKFGVFLLGVVLIFSAVISAQEIVDDTGSVDKAYQCLEDQIEEKSEDELSLEEAIFSTLALGSDSKLQSVLESNKNSDNDCWPRSSCRVKDTSQVLLAYERIGRSSSGIEEWLASREKDAEELRWYIEVDIQNHLASECTVRYDSTERKFNVNEDMTLEGSLGGCLEVSYGGYWLGIKESCLNKEYTISCDEGFVTALAYQKNTGGTVFISSETHSASSLGTTKEQASAKCLGVGGACEYEGTLWAAVALENAGNDVSKYIPYLLAFASENQRYLPSAFLYKLTGGNDQYNEIVQKQKRGSYWEQVGSPYNRFYDTSVAMLALAGTGSGERESAKQYLLSIQTDDGCWNNNNIRDTAFILYSGWGREVPKTGGGGSGPELCESAGYSCESAFACREAGGEILYNFDCSSEGLNLCCSVKVSEQTCAEKSGLICGPNQECEGSVVSSVDGSCCIGSCINRQEENTCEEIYDGECRTGCFDNEEEGQGSCPDGGICCFEKEKPERNYLFWIILLSILIILVILAIIYRDKLKFMWYKWRGKVRSRRFERPRGHQGYGRGPPPPRRRFLGSRRPRAGPATVRKTTNKDKELEETMRKLREMSK